MSQPTKLSEADQKTLESNLQLFTDIATLLRGGLFLGAAADQLVSILGAVDATVSGLSDAIKGVKDDQQAE